jgi:hypothetical protein
MEIIIAILWYLQLFFVNQTYTVAQVNTMIQQNQPAIQQVMSNPVTQQQAVQGLYQVTNNPSGNIIETWEDDPPEPEIH